MSKMVDAQDNKKGAAPFRRIEFRDVSGLGYVLRLDTVQLVYSQQGVFTSASFNTEPLKPSLLPPIYNEDTPGETAGANRFIVR
jgi:hypothetical protein